MPLLGVGYVKWHRPMPYSTLFKFLLFQSMGGGGGGTWALLPFDVHVTVVQPGFVNRGPKRGSEATKREEGVGGGFPLPR